MEAQRRHPSPGFFERDPRPIMVKDDHIKPAVVETVGDEAASHFYVFAIIVMLVAAAGFYLHTTTTENLIMGNKKGKRE